MTTTTSPDLGTGGAAANVPGSQAPSNPANAPRQRVTEATRRSMSLPQLSLSVPELPGYYLYWHLEQNIDAAFAAGYEFVERDEIALTNKGVANDQEQDGNDDLGSRVSRHAGGLVPGTVQSQRLYLMKLRQEWRDKDVAAVGVKNEAIAAALRGGTLASSHGAAPEETHGDKLKRYLKTGQDLFIPKSQRK